MDIEKLRKRPDFLALTKSPKWLCPCFVIQARKRDDAGDYVRLGFIITKKVGTAVVRNRIRRRLRVAAKEVLLENCKPGYDIVIIGRGEALDIRFDRLKALILAGLGQLKLKKGEK